MALYKHVRGIPVTFKSGGLQLEGIISEGANNNFVTSSIVVHGDRSWRRKEGQFSVDIIEYRNKIAL